MNNGQEKIVANTTCSDELRIFENEVTEMPKQMHNY
jgi:hypothetical protein